MTFYQRITNAQCNSVVLMIQPMLESNKHRNATGLTTTMIMKPRHMVMSVLQNELPLNELDH